VQEPHKKRARFSKKDVLEDLRMSWIRFGAHLPEPNLGLGEKCRS
jgi:hypothetical protein